METSALPRVLPICPAEEYWFAEGCHILELSNDADDDALSIARARVAAGQTTRWHRLHGISERYVIQEGRGRVELGGPGGIVREVGPGDVVRIPPLCPQRIHNTGEGDLVFLALCTPRFVPTAYEDMQAAPGA